ncbi:hypothetical protein TRFO_16521 [Tritrichomonas foetus]|uniref:Uncharacterized protein n=1 Tax=Tritrichomonas foetus TaxID=1144522 RepID=A0A1J4KQD8_9EUKA|nr:hypothetical protein TRFO_16521 [Tritrichomonas foetus]|eukprot:OHT13322.1 hypothetical protein TRFO_16521 [Tritrichomonas foetus]
MNTSLHLSMLSAEEELENADEEKEIEVIQNRITSVRTLLERLNEDEQERHHRYDSQLNELAMEIQQAKHIRDIELEKQKMKYQEKKLELLNQLDEEKLQFESHFRQLLKQSQQYEQNFGEIMNLKDQYFNISQQRKSIVEDAKQLEEEKKIEQLSLQKTLARKMQKFQLNQQMNRLEHDVSELLSQRRDIEKTFKLKRAELVNKYEVSIKDHNILAQRLQKDINDRDNQYKLHLDIVKHQIEKENQRNDIERQAAEVQCVRLQELNLSIQRNCTQQISKLNRDIEQMKKLLEEAEQDDEKTQEENLINTKKLFDQEKSTNSIRQNAMKIENELTQTIAFNIAASNSTISDHSSPTPKRTRVKKQAIFT